MNSPVPDMKLLVLNDAEIVGDTPIVQCENGRTVVIEDQEQLQAYMDDVIEHEDDEGGMEVWSMEDQDHDHEDQIALSNRKTAHGRIVNYEKDGIDGVLTDVEMEYLEDSTDDVLFVGQSRPEIKKKLANSSKMAVNTKVRFAQPKIFLLELIVSYTQTSSRIPDVQKERLVQLIQNSFTKAVGRFAGTNGVAIKAKLWRNIANELNTLGPSRTSEQWKTVSFNEISCNCQG